MKPVVLLRDPDLHISTLAGEDHTGIDHTTVRIGNLLPHLNRRLNNSISLEDSSVGVVLGDAEGDRAPTLISPSRSHTSHINDNYCVSLTPSHVRTVQLDPKFQIKVMAKTLNLDSLVTQTITSSVVSKTLNSQDLFCPAVSHIHIVHSHGPPQKKGVSPGQCLSKIKHVKGVFV